MSYEKTVWAGEGTLAREQEYNYHWCYERGIITKAWLDVHAATGRPPLLRRGQGERGSIRDRGRRDSDL